MESKEDSIKILEKRIRQQMNRPLEKYMEPENIQYYVSASGMLQKRGFGQGSQINEREGIQRDIPIDAKGNQQGNIYVDAKGNVQRDIHIDERGNLTQEFHISEKEDLLQKVHMSEKENLSQEFHMSEKEDLSQEFHMSEKEDLSQEFHIDGKENPQRDIDTDEKSDLRHETFGSGNEIFHHTGYEKRPVDMEYINRISGMNRIIEHTEISETKEAQHAKAKNSYESVRKSLNAEKFFPFQKKGLFDIKG